MLKKAVPPRYAYPAEVEALAGLLITLHATFFMELSMSLSTTQHHGLLGLFNLVDQGRFTQPKR
jgi:hypothetical protein